MGWATWCFGLQPPLKAAISRGSGESLEEARRAKFTGSGFGCAR